jgi:hypothetical protein
MNVFFTVLLLPLGLLTVQPGFKPGRFVATGKFRLHASVSRAFTMFEPIGEKEWAQGWDPNPIYPDVIKPVEGAVFTTREKGEPSIWTITRYERGRTIEYSVVSPGHDTTQISVACKGIAESVTEVTVSYRITGLSEQGNEYGLEHKSMFGSVMDHWRERISLALAAN